jgi:uroporphyrinogen-III synthase
LQRENPVILPLFSPNTTRQLVGQGPFAAPLFVAAISQNAGVELDEMATRRLVVADRPDAAAMVKAIDALIAAARSIESGKGTH